MAEYCCRFAEGPPVPVFPMLYLLLYSADGSSIAFSKILVTFYPTACHIKKDKVIPLLN
jgi:hypothetical protein